MQLSWGLRACVPQCDFYPSLTLQSVSDTYLTCQQACSQLAEARVLCASASLLIESYVCCFCFAEAGLRWSAGNRAREKNNSDFCCLRDKHVQAINQCEGE